MPAPRVDRVDWWAVALGTFLALPWGVLALILALAGCDGPDGAAGPTGPVASAVGTWAAELPSGGLVRLELASTAAYTATITPPEGILSRERGRWHATAARVYFDPDQCEAADQAGASLHLVACSGPDSLPAPPGGTSWPVTLDAGGQLVPLTFRRL